MKGALAHGFATDVWTLERIATVIQELTVVALSNPSVWRLLPGRLGWSMQRPQQGAAAASAWIVFFDESGISLIPPARRAWSVRGRTPVLRHRIAWKRASMATALGYRPGPETGSTMQARLCFYLQADSYDTGSLIGEPP